MHGHHLVRKQVFNDFFPNPWQRYVCVLSCVRLFATPCASPPGSSLDGILQARILEWIAIPFSRDCLDPGLNLCLLHLLHYQVDSLPLAPPGKSMALQKDNLFVSWQASFHLPRICRDSQSLKQYLRLSCLMCLFYEWVAWAQEGECPKAS